MICSVLKKNTDRLKTPVPLYGLFFKKLHLMTKRKKVSHKKKKWRDVLRPCQVGNVFRTDKWLSGDAVMRKLCVSRRTLQNYRDNRILPYSVVEVQKKRQNHIQTSPLLIGNVTDKDVIKERKCNSLKTKGLFS